MAYERSSSCEDCGIKVIATGSRGRVPKRCANCATKRKVAYNRARYAALPPGPRPRKIHAPSRPRYRTIVCAECGQGFEVQIKVGGLPKSCEPCRHDRQLRLSREIIRPFEVRLARLRRYKLTVQQWQSMVESQGNKCAICGLPPMGEHGRTSILEVDHCHETGAVRALLCQTCNTALGKFKDSPELLRKAADYVENHKTCHKEAI